MSDLKYINTCACVDAIDRITSKTFLRLSREFRICFLKRDLIISLVYWGLKSVISNIGSLREKNDMSAYINMYDLVTFGLVELNFDDTEKATNILPDFRIGKRGCEYAGIDYDRYIENQVPIDKYKGRVLDVECRDTTNSTWSGILHDVNTTIFDCVRFHIDDFRLIDTVLEVFLEEMFYDLGEHKVDGYVYKLFDILYFNYKDEDGMWGTDVMPEYKLMVKDDKAVEDFMDKACEEYNKIEEQRNKLHWNNNLYN